MAQIYIGSIRVDQLVDSFLTVPTYVDIHRDIRVFKSLQFDDAYMYVYSATLDLMAEKM